MGVYTQTIFQKRIYIPFINMFNATLDDINSHGSNKFLIIHTNICNTVLDTCINTSSILIKLKKNFVFMFIKKILYYSLSYNFLRK